MGEPYAYLRKSVIRRDQRTISPETQEREVRELAARYGDNGTRLVILADWDISGRRQSKKKRVEYQKLEDAIRSGAASAVYSYSLSRLSRSVSDLSELFDLCRDHKVPIRLVADNLDTSTASGMLTAHILAGMAQFESDVASERVLDMYQSKRARGEEIRTSRRYGEVKVRADGTVLGEDENAEVVLQAFDRAGTYAGAAKWLNANGVKPRMAERWWSSSVREVVRRLRPEMTRRAPAKGIKPTGAKFVLARLLECPTCKRFLTGSNLRENNTERRRIRYACRGTEQVHHPRVAISEVLILPAIRDMVDALELPGDRVEFAARAEAERQDIEAERERVATLFAKGKIDEPLFDKMTTDIEARLERVTGTPVLEDLPRIDWDHWDASDINNVLRRMVDHVELDADFRPVRIHWRPGIAEWAR